MATVFQLVLSGERTLAPVDHDLVNVGHWHVGISTSHPITLCGIQLEGEDGITVGPEKEGRVTCPICRRVIEQVQSIKNWK